MNIKIWRKDEVELGFSKGDYLISILSTRETPLSDEVKSRYKEVLELRIDDIQKEYDGLTLFSMEHLIEIKGFVWGIYDSCRNDVLDIHCTAGVSRSPAIALGIACELYEISMAINILKENEYIRPNKYILNYFINNDEEWSWINGYLALKDRVTELSKEDLEKCVLNLGLSRQLYRFLLRDRENKIKYLKEYSCMFDD